MNYKVMLRFWRLVIGGRDREFWDLTPCEFYSYASEFARDAKALGRDDLQQMMKRFPDVKEADSGRNK